MKMPLFNLPFEMSGLRSGEFSAHLTPGLIWAGEEGGGSSSGAEGGIIPDPVIDPDQPGGTRPWPDPEAAVRDDAKCNIYALLVGINDYASAPLGGCLSDVEQIETYLKNKYSDDRLHLRILRDSEATYENIMAGFREHLALAGEQDTAWFHFSGHGTESYTADEFLPLEATGKDQNLVCYMGGSNAHFLLADKELAVLLHEVSTQDPQGRAKKNPHLVVSLDCCHSGSGTRDHDNTPNLKTRMMTIEGAQTRAEAFGAGRVRNLESYAGGFYANLATSGKPLEVPAAKHVLIAACESIEQAGDLPEGGVFTTSMIQALEGAQGNINYADLFVRTRATAHRIRPEQTPQFDTIANFDPYTRFLAGTAFGEPDRYEIELEGETWFVKCGAIQGLPVSPDQPIEMEIYPTGSEGTPSVALAHLGQIGAQRSTFTWVAGSIEYVPGAFQGVLRHLPAPPVQVFVHGEADGVALLLENWDASKNILAVEDAAHTIECELEVEATGEKFVIRDRLRDKTVQRLPQDAAGTKICLDALGKIVKWRRTAALNNENSVIRKWVDFDLGVKNQRMEEIILKSPVEELIVSPTTFFAQPGGVIGAPFFPRVVITNATQNLYCYLLHLRGNYSIESYESEIVFRPDEHPNKTRVQMPLWKKQWGWGLSGDENESTSYFKLLVTTESLDYQQLLQSGIQGHRDMVFNWAPVGVSDDWCSITIKVTMVREGSTESVEAS